MRYRIRTVGPVAPAESIPALVSLDEAKAHLRIDNTVDDDQITAFVAAAEDAIERHTSQILTPRVLEVACFGFPCSGFMPGLRAPQHAFEIPREPITSIVSVAYTDTTGADVDLDESAWRWSESLPMVLRPAWSTNWPRAAAEDGSVRITFEAGYEEGLCPASLVTAVKLMVGHLYGNREEVVVDMRAAAIQLPFGVDRLCAPFRRASL